MKNLLTGNRQVQAIYYEGSDLYDINGVHYQIDYYTSNDFRLKPIEEPPQGYTSYMGDGYTATIKGGTFDGYTDVTVLSRAETWEEYEFYSR